MKLSIITINYNNLEGLRKTIDSVVSQTWRDFEWIVVDGGSTDGSRELIEEYAIKGYFAWWCSEPDKGIYNAMNKGFLKSTGNYIQYLNSGDIYTDENVLRDFSLLTRKEDIITGNIIIDGNIDDCRTSPYEADIDFEYMCSNTILHPSSFVKREIFGKCGMFDESLKIVADWKFFLISLIQYSCTYWHWNRIIVDFNSNGISESAESSSIINEERERVLQSFMPFIQRTIAKKDNIIKNQNISILNKIQTIIKNRVQKRIHHWKSIPCKYYLRKRGYFRKNKKKSSEELIVSMTSWKKRINNVSSTIQSILNNTVKVDRIILNLSIDEFPDKEAALPNILVELEHKGVIEIIWHQGNTKAFKKFLHTIKKYPDAAVITIDDDFIYPSYFIETFKTMHERYPDNPLSGNHEYIDGVKAHCGCASLVKLQYFGTYLEDLLDGNIINYGMDDIFYTYCATLNGAEYVQVGRTFFMNMVPNNPIEGLSEGHVEENDKMKAYLICKVRSNYNIDLSNLSEPVFCF